MFYLIRLIKSFMNPSLTLTRLEKTILDAIKNNLQSPQAELWNHQIEAINKVNRSPDGLEVNFYVMRNGKSDFPKELCFAKNEEFKIAVLDFSAIDIKQKLRARVWCVNGHVFSIEYKTSFKAFEQAAQGKWNVSCHIENYPA